MQNGRDREMLMLDMGVLNSGRKSVRVVRYL